jgi:MinD-like ATPase involved in chromosome partitioning or flagellar assembly
MVKNEQDLRSPEIIQSVCEDFLNIKPEILGHIFYDPMVELAINKMDPSLFQERSNRAVKCFDQIAKKVVKLAHQSKMDMDSEQKNVKKAVTLSKSRGVI